MAALLRVTHRALRRVRAQPQFGHTREQWADASSTYSHAADCQSTRDLPGRADSATVRRPAHDGARLPRARRRSSRGRGPDPTDQTAEVRVPRRGEGRKRRSREAVEVDAAQAHRIAAGLAALPPGVGAVRSCEGVSAMAGPEPKVPGLAVIVHVPDS